MGKSSLTPVPIRPVTKERLLKLKVYPRETWDDVVTRLVDDAERALEERREEPRRDRRRAS